MPRLDEPKKHKRLSGLFNQGSLVTVLDEERLAGVITKIDLIEYMAKKLHS